MCSKLASLIAKAGLDDIYNIINPAVMELINEFDKNPNKLSLANILCEIYPISYFLEKKQRRERLFQYLSEKEVKKIMEVCSEHYYANNNIWHQLNKINFNKQKLNYLYQYFGYEINIEKNKKTFLQKKNSECIKSTYGLFKHQEKATHKIKSYLESGSRVLLHMPTGSGKTRTTMSVICDFIRNLSDRSLFNNRLVIWLADTEELCDQAADEFIKAWSSLGIGDIYLHRFYSTYDQDFSELKKGGVLVAGMQKLNQRLSKSQQQILRLGEKAELLVFDEAHRILAPTYQELVDLLQVIGKAPLIGLSATPGRSTFDQEHNKEFAKFFNKNKVILSVEGYDSPIDYLVNQGYIAKANFHTIPYTPEDFKLTPKQIKDIASGQDIPIDALEQLGIDAKRNLLIIDSILKEVNNERQIIVFGCSVVNAEALYALLRYKNINVGIVTSSTESSLRKTTISDYKKGNLQVIVNYGVLTTGFDAPKTNVAIVARPTTSLTLYSQMIGRATRGKKAGGNENCDIYTVVDSTIPAFHNMVKAFSHWDDAWN